MQVKRFFAADMRQAMKLVRDELGAEAAIIGNRRIAGGVELMAALDYKLSALAPRVPNVELEATSGAPVNPARIIGPAVIFCYPFTGRPGYPNPPNWDHIKGAHGSTPQAQPIARKHWWPPPANLPRPWSWVSHGNGYLNSAKQWAGDTPCGVRFQSAFAWCTATWCSMNCWKALR